MMNLKELEAKLALARQRGASDDTPIRVEFSVHLKAVTQVWMSSYLEPTGGYELAIRYDDDDLPGDLHDPRS